jgi:hypothetical protein
MKYYTGNDHISLINVEKNLTINGLTTLCMGLNGNLFLSCSIKLRLYDDDGDIDLNKGYFELVNYWIPKLTVKHKGENVVITLLAPRDMRGFMFNIKGMGVRAEVEIFYKDLFININTPHRLEPQVKTYFNEFFRHGIFSFTLGGFILALSAGASKDALIDAGGNTIRIADAAKDGQMNFYFGLGCEEMAASSCCVEFARRGFGKYESELCRWLEDRLRGYKDKAIERVYNTNLFFSYFFGYGKAIDTEELVAVTSRSPEYYVSGAYWDRDTLLWSLPAILAIDENRAKEILDYVFRVQGKNFGVHSRFINGNTLEYGFELDELCAPFIALESYLKKTGDNAILERWYFDDVLKRATERFAEWKHESEYIFRTELRPSDDMINHEFNVYDNVLAWKAFNSLDYIFKLLNRPADARHFKELAVKVKKGLKKYALLSNGMIAYEFDLDRKCSIYEEPAGSIRLLAHYGFLDKDFQEYYDNTVEWVYSDKNEYFYGQYLIRESGCLHARGPWALSAANSLLTPGYEKYGIDFFKNAKMDNYYACESVNAETGVVETGRAFATCAGFIAYAISAGYKE